MKTSAKHFGLAVGLEAKVLLHNKVASVKRLIKRQGEGKARETLKDIFAMIEEMDADPASQ